LILLCIIIIVSALGIATAEEDRLTIKFHSIEGGKNVSIDLAKYLPKADIYHHSKTENVTISIKNSIATITPKIGWLGDEIITFFANKSLAEEIEKKEKPDITNIEPIIEMSFPAMKTFVVSPGQIEFGIVAFDPDNDAVNVQWLVNGNIEKEEGAKGSIISHFTYNQTSLQKRGGILKSQQFKEDVTRYIVNAIVNDSRNSKTIEWRFNVINSSCVDKWQCSNWSGCVYGKHYRECKKINVQCEYNTYMPPTEWLDPVCMQKNIKCEPNWTCSDWQVCKLSYDIKIITAGKITDAVKPRQERLCYDMSYCVGNVGVESRTCNETIPIKTNRVEWCNGKYIEIFNADTGQFVSRIRELTSGEEPSMDIELTLKELSRQDYCWYCYDGKEDYDEIAVDCGGSCAECVEISASPTIFDFATLASFIIADALLIFYIIMLVRKR